MLSKGDYLLLLAYREPTRAPDRGTPDAARFAALRAEYLKVYSYRSAEAFGGLSVPYLYVLSAKGADAVSEFEDAADHDAKREKQQSFQNKVSVASVLVPAVSFILGLIVEHYAGIVGLFLSLNG